MTLFNSNAPTGSPTEDNQQGSAFETLVGEGKKYKDNEALAYSKIEADRFIETMKQEAREKEAEIQRLHKELQARISLEDAVNKITKPVSNNAITSNQSTTNGDESNAFGGNGKPTGLTAEEAERLFEQKLLNAQQELIHKQNLATVADELNKAWGADTDIRLRTKARELGLSEEQVDGIAKNNPKALLAMFGVGQSGAPAATAPSGIAPPRSSIPTQQSKIVPGVKNKAYWDAMRTNDPSLYHSQLMTIQRHRAALDLGDRYFD